MDPTLCLIELLREMHEGGRRDDILDRIADLRDWIRRGGFYPDINKVAVALGDMVDEV